MSKAKQPKPQEQVWIVHIGYSDVAMPSRAAANALLAALTTATLVRDDHESEPVQYYLPPPYSRPISFEVIPGDRLHLCEKPTKAVKAPPPVADNRRLNGTRQLLLEGKATP
jgi:hypothetical protein